MGKFKTIVVTALVTAFAAGCVAWNVRGLYDMFIHRDLYSKVAGIKEVLDSSYLYDYDEEMVADYAAAGMTMALDDPYTVYYSKKQFEEYSQSGQGDFVGVGVTVSPNLENDEIEVVSVMDNSPGMEAGILPGDVIVAVEGVRYSGSQMNEAVAKIRGTDLEAPENTSISITVRRDKEEFDVTLTRKRVHQKTVTYSMEDNFVGVIKISSFNRASDIGEKSTGKEFEEALDKLTTEGMDKLIIDLRDNGGGDLNAVSSVIDQIVPEGLIMYSEDKYGKRDEIFSDESELNIPIAVLVNGNSASAAELLTGALRDYKKATIIGTKTFGKGVMQSVYPFSDGSGIVVTIAKYYTPAGISIHEEGITPDIVVEPLEEYKDSPVDAIERDKDIQLKTAIEFLNN